MNNDSEVEPRRGVSRRGFLTGTGAAAAITSLTGELVPPAVGEEKPEKPPAFGPGPVPVELTVNGKKVTTNVEPRVTLLDALRDYLDVTGCKRVCDRATCGACTVILNGRPVYSCLTLALEARGAEVRTAKSLGADGRLDFHSPGESVAAQNRLRIGVGRVQSVANPKNTSTIERGAETAVRR